jgi:hypothetical protein
VLFGVAGTYSAPKSAYGTGAAGTPSGADQEGRRGALSVHDCYGDAITERLFTHVAVDRWTGGAAENMLFHVQEPAAANWDPIRMSLDTGRLNDFAGDLGGKVLALFLLVLRDLADGWLSMGFGGTRGRGTISVSQITFTGRDLPDPWAALTSRTLAEIIENPPEAVTRAFRSWQKAMSA